MVNKLIFGGIWLFFLIYAFAFSPGDDPETLDLIINLSTGNLKEINPLIVSLFNLMGVLPAIYACFILIDGRGQKLPAWAFVMGSFGVGAFALLPYLALRQPNSSAVENKSWLLKAIESPLTGIVLTLTTLSLIFFGITNGNWSDFVAQWQTSKFINVMSLDFCLLCLLLPVLLRDDLKRRGVENTGIFSLISFVPLLGTLAYLCVRSSLNKSQET